MAVQTDQRALHPQLQLSRRLTLVDDQSTPRLPEILERFLGRYSNRHSRTGVGCRLRGLFAYLGADHPAAVTENGLQEWITSGCPANNTVRNRLSTARTFYKWCVRTGLTENNPAAALDHLTKSYPRTYGKVQASNPARWLTDQQAFGDLVAACGSGTDIGHRDELVIRLGLSGMRSAEIRTLTWSCLSLDCAVPSIAWTGKGNRPRHVAPGPNLVEALRSWRDTWTRRTGHHPEPHHYIVPPILPGDYTTHRLNFGSIAGANNVPRIVNSRAKLAGLGHVAPHDLRRTAAGLLHHATTQHGGHLFDLLDIQKVLGHSDPATTMRSYLDPIDTDVIDRAGAVLD